MRLSTAFGLGAALAVLPLVGVVTFSVDSLQRVARQNETLTLRQLAAVRVAIGVLARLERLAEYEQKYSVSGDPGYAEKANEARAALDREIQALRTADLSASEREALERFVVAWDAYKREGLPSGSEARAAPTEELVRMSDLVRGLLQRSEDVALAEAEAARRTRAETTQAAVLATVLALGASALLILLIVRRLKARLDQFIEGTQAVSRGALSFQLDERGRDELGQVARAFNRMVVSLDQLERTKADFISSVSHELKTPLVAMLETNSLLLDEVPGELNDKQRRMLVLNRQAAQRLHNMISDLLELSVVKAELRYRMAEEDLAPLTVVAVSELEPVAEERGLSLRVDVSASETPRARARASGNSGFPVLCDSDRYVQLVQNLVENALKYTPSGGSIRVRVRACAKDELPSEIVLPGTQPLWALLQVEDSGPGIPEVDRERVFEKFFRRQGRSSDGGVGLGLAICKEIVAAHRGAMWIGDSALGGASLNAAFPMEAPA